MLHRHPILSLLTGGYLLFVAWLTLTPQPITAPEQDLILRVLAELHERGYVLWLDFDRLEFLANIALFVPIGMFLVLLAGSRQWWLALLACFALTAFIETVQRDIPGRVSDGRDLLANSTGGVIGVLLALILTAPGELRRRRERRSVAALP
jgi:VanZ like family